MSFILDALRKSENQRQRQIGPSFADVPAGRRNGDKPWWLIAVATLLVVNLAVLAAVLTRGERAASAPAQDRQSTAAGAVQGNDTQVPLPATRSRIPRDDGPVRARSLAEEAAATYEPGIPPEADPTLAAAAHVPEGPPLVRRLDAPSVAPLARPPAAAGRPPAEESLPTIHELTASGFSIPEMHVDIHVYSANPAERFVFVNMRKYREGETLSEGLLLERIRADGLVLNHHGRRFLLTR